ncbi:MAG: glycosyltransferase family 2 protein [Mycoplasma sp.]|nr:glycosyltransferase family 2 protein [Mycoplasma sp.]
MFDLEVKNKQNKFSTLFNFAYKSLVLVPISLLFFISNVVFNLQNNLVLRDQINISCVVILITISAIVYIVNFAMSFKWRRLAMLEFLDIANNTKLPKKLPKVIYVYTTKNDFMPARLLQNMQQSYKNIEYWISVGGKNDINIEKIKKFAKENNVNLFVMDRPSNNKADNLNSFLKYNKSKFDYLLIGDADVAFDKNFVETSLKFFYSDKAIRLGYVSSTLMNYRGNNAFTNAILAYENERFIIRDQNSNYYFNFSANLYSSCCLISRKMLEEMNYEFPDSNLEDQYTEKFANKNAWVGIISPLSIAMQSFDKDIWANLNRISRVFTWGIKYQKTQFFNKYSVRYSNTNKKHFQDLFLGFIFIFGFIMTTILVWWFFINYKNIFTGVFQIVTLSSFIINGLLILISRGILLKHLSENDGIKISILVPFYNIVLMINLFKYWFEALFLSRYKTFLKTEKFNVKNKTIILWIQLFVFLSILISGNCVLFVYKTYNINNGWIYLIIFFNFVFLFAFLYCLSFLVLIWAGKIRSNYEYSDDNFVYCTNNFILQTRVKKEYIELRKGKEELNV